MFHPYIVSGCSRKEYIDKYCEPKSFFFYHHYFHCRFTILSLLGCFLGLNGSDERDFNSPMTYYWHHPIFGYYDISKFY
jgi:hypothetical protein